MKARLFGEYDRDRNYSPGGECMLKGFRPPSSHERAKYRAAQQAGLLERIMEVGWAGLSAKESGRIGGILAHMERKK